MVNDSTAESPDGPSVPGAGSDAELLVASAADGDLFGELFERHNTAVLAYFIRRTACPQTAADLTAETFAQAFASRGRFTRTGAPARAWLFTIARRQLARFVRKEQVSAKYRRRLGIEATTRLGSTDIERIEELADSDPQRAAVAAALEQLPANQREAVRLRIAQDLPYPTVAERLGCSEGAARVRVSRGLTALADLLDPGNPGTELETA
jgi:RNA polymerase sigma-70 factor (ECF subfamily)